MWVSTHHGIYNLDHALTVSDDGKMNLVATFDENEEGAVLIHGPYIRKALASIRNSLLCGDRITDISKFHVDYVPTKWSVEEMTDELELNNKPEWMNGLPHWKVFIKQHDIPTLVGAMIGYVCQDKNGLFHAISSDGYLGIDTYRSVDTAAYWLVKAAC